MDLLTLVEGHRQVEGSYVGHHLAGGSQTLSHARELGVESGHMLERVEGDVAVEFAVYHPQNVEVEFGRDSGRVVVGGDHARLVLHQIHAQQEQIAGVEGGGNRTQQ